MLQEGGLQVVEPEAVADHGVVRLALVAVVAQDAHRLGHVGVGGGDRAAVAEGAEVLARIEAEGGDDRRANPCGRPL